MRKILEENYNNYIDRWKEGLETGKRGCAVVQVSNHVRRYIIYKYKGKCALCGWCGVNPVTGKSPLEIHHIDGDSENTTEENMILLCPNCHSLTPNYRSLNKEGKRTWKRHTNRSNG